MWAVAGLVPGCFAPTGSGGTDGAGTDTTGGAAMTSTGAMSTGGVTGTGLPTTGEASTTGDTSVATDPSDPSMPAGTMNETTGATSSDGSTGTTGANGNCGNGELDAGEECDVGVDNGNNKPCTLECKTNVCGDGLPCKDCGQPCDDGNTLGEDGCSEACTWEERVVFVTDKAWTGKELGGVIGADQKCDAAAKAIVELKGREFRAWLSKDNVDTALLRIGEAFLPYVRRDGMLVADDSGQFMLGSIKAPINVTETLNTPVFSDCGSGKNMVWTGTEMNGGASGDTCSVWSMAGVNGRVGNLSSMGAEWTACTSLPCDTLARLYCFQVN